MPRLLLLLCCIALSSSAYAEVPFNEDPCRSAQLQLMSVRDYLKLRDQSNNAYDLTYRTRRVEEYLNAAETQIENCRKSRVEVEKQVERLKLAIDSIATFEEI
jgi:hypothetical protein